MKHFFVYLLGFAGGIVLHMIVNNIQTGNPFTFAFNKYNEKEKWGFEGIGHTPIKGLWNLTYAFMRMSFWSAPFLVFFSLFNFKNWKNKAMLLWIPIIGIIVFYFSYYSLGIVEFGSRYHFSAFLILIILAAGGFNELQKLLCNMGLVVSNSLSFAFVSIIALYMAMGVLPQMLPIVNNVYANNKSLFQWMENPPEVPERALIFLRDVPVGYPDVFIRNHWQYEKSHHIRALFLDPKINRELIKTFSDRKPFIMYFDHDENRFRIAPYPEMSETDPMETPQYYIFAAINYRKALLDKDMMEKMLLKALEKDPKSIDIKLYLGYLYFEMGQYEKGIEILEPLTKEDPPSPQALYYLGKCLGETGRIEEGINALISCVNIDPHGQFSEKAKDWLIYYNRIKGDGN